MKSKATKIAIVQESPVPNSLSRSIKKAISIIQKAAKKKTQLLVFGESWLCGYPAWIDYCKDVSLWDHPPVKKAWAEMYKNSICLNSKELRQLQTAIKKHKLWVVLGLNEVIHSGKGNGTLYNSVLTFNPKGAIVNHHRKLMPTFTERLVHGTGDGNGLQSVDTPFGRLGSLICWEHWMPLSRQAMHDTGEDIHIALWPMVKANNIIASQQYAHEGRCYVIATGQMLYKKDLPKGLELKKEQKSDALLKGGSCIIGPNCEMLLEPQYDKNETIYFDLPPVDDLIPEKMNLAVSGHYQRPDVFNFEVNRKRLY